MFQDSDDDREDPIKVRRGAAHMKSIFASDESSVRGSNQSLRYEGPSKRGGAGAGGGDDFSMSQPKASAGAPPVPQQGQSNIACNGAIHAYKGENPVGAAAIVVASSAQAGTVCVIIDREKRHLCRVKMNDSFQLLPNPQQRQYATLFDPGFGGHWTLAFKDVASCNQFLAGALTVQHFLLLPDGPRAPMIELGVAAEGPMIKKGDTAQVSLSVYLMQKKGALTTVGKLVEEIVDEAPRRIVVGDNSVMVGVDEALVGMGAGGRKLVFVPPRKTKMGGLGNPEITGSDSVVALVSVAAVEPYDASMGLDDARNSLAASNRKRGESVKGGGGGSRRRGDSFAESSSDHHHHHQSHQQHQQQQPAASSAQHQQQQQPAAAAASASPAPGADTNSLIQALLLQTLASKNQQQEPERKSESKQDTSSRGDGSAFVERSLTMIQQQLSALYEKLDRVEIEKKLDENNMKIERMVKKAVGKLPTLDVDVEDAGKDREALLAKIEQLKEKAEQHKADYYAALETLGKHKEETSALKNDIAIATRSAEEKIQELKERHRLEVVDNEVRYRKNLDRISEERYAEGKEKGYNDGFNVGRIEGLTQSGSASTEELREKLAQKESENIELQARIVEIEAKGYEERRASLDQQQALQGIIDRLEERNTNKEKSVVDTGALNAKFLRRVMNSAYSAIETQFYATEKETIDVSDALNMVLVSIKSESRQAADELKKLALIQSKEVTPLAPLPFDTTHHHDHHQQHGASSSRSSNNKGSEPSSIMPPPPPPPPPPPMNMFSGSASGGGGGAGGSSSSSPAAMKTMPPSSGSVDSLTNAATAAALAGGVDLGGSHAGGGGGGSAGSDEIAAQTGAAAGSGGGGGGDVDEDFVQKMLAEYRAQREKELAAGGGTTAPAAEAGDEGASGDDTVKTSNIRGDDGDDASDSNKAEDNVVPIVLGDGPAAAAAALPRPTSDDVADQPNDDENDNDARDGASHHHEDPTAVDNDDDDDDDDDEVSAPVARPSTKKPKPPKIARDEEDEEW